jgi:hypothetical protein
MHTAHRVVLRNVVRQWIVVVASVLILIVITYLCKEKNVNRCLFMPVKRLLFMTSGMQKLQKVLKVLKTRHLSSHGIQKSIGSLINGESSEGVFHNTIIIRKKPLTEK